MSPLEPPESARPVLEVCPDFETLIIRLSARLLAAVPEGITAVVIEALDDVRVFLGADRCGLLSVGDEGRVVRIVHASYGEGIRRVSEELDLANAFPWSRRILVDQGRPVCIGRLDDLPPEAAVDRATYADASIRSSLTVPIPVGQHVEHLIAVQTVRTEAAWPAPHVARIRLLGEMLVNALERARSYLAISESERRASVAADSADAGLWVLELATNALWMSDRARGPAGPAQATSGGA